MQWRQQPRRLGDERSLLSAQLSQVRTRGVGCLVHAQWHVRNALSWRVGGDGCTAIRCKTRPTQLTNKHTTRGPIQSPTGVKRGLTMPLGWRTQPAFRAGSEQTTTRRVHGFSKSARATSMRRVSPPAQFPYLLRGERQPRMPCYVGLRKCAHDVQSPRPTRYACLDSALSNLPSIP